MQTRFNRIYKYNFWGGKESVSGVGSSLEATATLRAELPLLFKKFQLNTIFDAPCGDFHWMNHVMATCNVKYVGGDIVEQLINQNSNVYERTNVHFLHFDITKDKMPQADIWICRHCLFHLSYQHILEALQCFLASSIPYILTTTHLRQNQILNSDIQSGDFRLIDLFSSPFCFPEDIKFRCDDFIVPDPPMEICLWHRNQITNAVNTMKSRLI